MKVLGYENPQRSADNIIWLRFPADFLDGEAEPTVESCPYLRGADSEEVIDGVVHHVVNFVNRKTGVAFQYLYRR